MPPKKYGRVASKSSPPPPVEEPEPELEFESEPEVRPESEVASDLSDLTEPESDVEEAAQPAAKAPAKAKTTRKTKEAAAPTRRSTRVASTTVADAAPPAKSSTKRKAVSQDSLADIEAKLRKTTLATDKEKAQKVPRAQEKPYLNPLPQIPEHVRPAPLLFAWGAGNAGQFGMGLDAPNALGELTKPTRNKLVEQMIADGKFGGKGAGFEVVAAGGMSTLLVDEKGTVRGTIFLYTRISYAFSPRSGHAVTTITLL